MKKLEEGISQMLKINKTEEPNFIFEFKRKNSPRNWEDYNWEIKNHIKDFILEHEQEFYCPYCERRIYESSVSYRTYYAKRLISKLISEL